MWEGGGRGASDRILSYYSYLFGFPSHRVLLLEQVVVTLIGGALPLILYKGVSSLLPSLLFALSTFTLPSLLSDLLTSLLLSGDLLFTPRRCTALSLVASLPWVSILILFGLAARLTGSHALIPRAFMAGFSFSLSLRLLALYALTSRDRFRALLSSILQPLSCLFFAIPRLPIDWRSLLLGLTSSLILLSAVWLVVKVVERWRGDREKIRLLPLFQAFLLAWAEGIGEPLEEYLEKIGEEADLPIGYLIFHSRGGPKGVLMVPYIHSGPFRNVGSSALPYLTTKALGEALGCEALFLHGVSSHDRDLSSQVQNKRVIQALLEGIGRGVEGGRVSPLIRVRRDGATATCQLFDDLALVTLTVSPKSFDDLPQGLERRISQAGRGLGLETLVVDLHNSIGEEDELSEEDLSNLTEAALDAMRRALRAPRTPFRIGFSKVTPADLSLKDGMGPAGIGAMAVEVPGQTSVYVVIDANNMVSGLREELLSRIKGLGVDEAEVATTDTHIVNAVSVSPRGYYPLGERIDWERMAEYVKRAVAQALESLEPASFHYGVVEVKGLRIIGEGGLTYLGNILEEGFNLFKRSSLTILPLLGALSLSLLFLL